MANPAENRRMSYQEQMDAEHRVLVRRIIRIAKYVAGAFLLLALVFGSYYSVDESEKVVVTRFGAVVRVAGPGLHFKLPFFESTTFLSTKVQMDEYGPTENGNTSLASYSKDQQNALIAVKVTWRVQSDDQSITQVYAKYRDVEALGHRVVSPTTSEVVKTVFGQYDAVRVVQERDRFNIDIKEKFQADLKAAGHPVVLEDIQVQNIDFSQAYDQAIEARMQAQVEVEKISQNLAREKKTAEITVVQAEAQAKAKLAEAEAQAKAIRVKGEAEAAAIRARGDALRENPRLPELVTAERWNGVLPTYMTGGAPVPFISVGK